jgi:hypothetical protein
MQKIDMKRTNLLYKSMLLAWLIPLLFLGACKKDSLDSSDLLVYVAGDYASTTNTMIVPFLHTPVSVSGDSSIMVAASATRNVSTDVQVTFSPDTSFVSQYNLANKTSCLALPASTYKIVNTMNHTIKSGAISSDSMQILITDPGSLTNPGGYILPLRITTVTGSDKGIRISTNRNVVFVNVTYLFNNILNTQTPLAGTLVSRTGWIITVSNTTSGALGPAMVDGSNSTAWRSSNSTTAAKYAIVDMLSQQSVSGFQIVPDYVTTTENATLVKVSSSPDSTTWTVQGTWTGTGPATGSSATSPDIKGINFISPVQAKFFRFDILAVVSGGRAGIGELNAVH